MMKRRQTEYFSAARGPGGIRTPKAQRHHVYSVAALPVCIPTQEVDGGTKPPSTANSLQAFNLLPWLNLHDALSSILHPRLRPGVNDR